MTRAVRRVVLVAFAADALYLASACWAFTVSENPPFLLLGISLLVMWIVWIALLVVALVAARRQHAREWLLTFVVLGIIGIASTLFTAFKATTAPVFLLYFNLFQPFFQDTVERTVVGGALLFLALLLVAAIWFGRRRVVAAEVRG